MKLMIASDLHGSVACTERLLKRMDEENPKKLVLLGDLLYHGPRNILPMRYDTARVAELLNARRSSLFCVRGNCDTVRHARASVRAAAFAGGYSVARAYARPGTYRFRG